MSGMDIPQHQEADEGDVQRPIQRVGLGVAIDRGKLGNQSIRVCLKNGDFIGI